MANFATKTILVTGATGKQGGALIQNILASPDASSFHIVAITRDVANSRAQKLASIPNVSVVAGDLANPEAFFQQAGRPIWAVYSVQVNSDAEEVQGKALIDTAVLNGVQHFVYSSGDRGGPELSPNNPTTVKNFAAKHAIEKHLQQRAERSAQGLTWTILRPVSFMENLSGDIHGKGFARMWEQMNDAVTPGGGKAQKKKLQLVSTKDIGWFAAQSMLHPEEYKGRAITLVGDELTQPEAGVIFRKTMGFAMPMAACPVASAVKFVLKGTVGDMFAWFEKNGYGGDVEACRTANPGMQSFEAWLEENKGRWA